MTVAPIVLALASASEAADVPIAGLKLMVVDRTVSVRTSKLIFVAKDPAIVKGTATDAGQIEAVLGVSYDAVSGSFGLPQGTKWLANSATLARYLYHGAPDGGVVRTGILKPAAQARIVSKSLGDEPLDISSPPSGPVHVTYTVSNGGEITRLCTQFTACVHQSIENGTGHKLVCRGSSTGDPTCAAAAVLPSACYVDQGPSVLDTCTGLEWEKKATAVGSGANPADPNDVDNRYTWAGFCTINSTKRCQPSASAEAACQAQTPMAAWGTGCQQCTGGDGVCDVDPRAEGAVTTVWSWLSGLNAANFAGHADWRLPSEDGRLTGPNTDPRELETLLLERYPSKCGADPCPAIFGPTSRDAYWSGTSSGTATVFGVLFANGFFGNSFKDESLFHHVRGVRTGMP